MIFRLSNILRDPRLTAKGLARIYVDLDKSYSSELENLQLVLTKLRNKGYTVRLVSARLIEITP